MLMRTGRSSQEKEQTVQPTAEKKKSSYQETYLANNYAN